jgi:hypothetical protein
LQYDPFPMHRVAGWATPFVLAAALVALGFSVLHQYNVNWDEALGDLFFGQRYLSYFTTFDSRYLRFESDPYPPGHVPDLSSSPFRHDPASFYPVANTLAAGVSAFLSGRLGLLDPFDGFHAANLLLGAVLLVTLHRYLAPRFGAAAATAAVLFLFLSPRVVSDLLTNVKDFGESVFFSLTLLAFAAAYQAGSAAGIVGAGALFGLALGTKGNALFVPVIAALTVMAARRPAPWTGRSRTLGVSCVAALLAGAIVFYASWPYLWEDPVRHIGQNLRYLLMQKLVVREESMAPALTNIVLTTPIPFLAFVLAGMAAIAPRLRERDPPAVWLAAWVAVVVGRLYLPGAINFDGVRHFLELFPALAALAGIGLAWTADRAAAWWSRGGRSFVRIAVFALPLGVTAAELFAVHPFEIAYWNALAGGLGGAQARQRGGAGDYWALSYRLGLEWLNEHAPPRSRLVVPVAPHTVRLVAPSRLRPDIQLLPITDASSPLVAAEEVEALREIAGRRPVYVMFVYRRDWTNALVEYCRAAVAPAAQWRAGGGVVLSIYRLPGTS